MPILNKPSFITKLFSFRKTMTAASAPPVPKLGQQASVKQAPAPKQRKTAAGTHETHRSIFSRIASSFNAMRERNQIRNQNKAETRKVSKQIEENMINLKMSMPLELKNMRNNMKVEPQEISAAYIKDFSSLEKSFMYNEDMTVSSETIMTVAEKNPDESASGYAQHLLEFCGDDIEQASTLSTLLTKEAVNTVHQELKKYSTELHDRREVTKENSRVDIRMMPNGTARVTITRKVGSVNKADEHYVATIKTRFAVLRQAANPRFIGFVGGGFNFQNPILLENVECKYVLRKAAL